MESEEQMPGWLEEQRGSSYDRVLLSWRSVRAHHQDNPSNTLDFKVRAFDTSRQSRHSRPGLPSLLKPARLTYFGSGVFVLVRYGTKKGEKREGKLKDRGSEKLF